MCPVPLQALPPPSYLSKIGVGRALSGVGGASPGQGRVSACYVQALLWNASCCRRNNHMPWPRTCCLAPAQNSVRNMGSLDTPGTLAPQILQSMDIDTTLVKLLSLCFAVKRPMRGGTLQMRHTVWHSIGAPHRTTLPRHRIGRPMEGASETTGYGNAGSTNMVQTHTQISSYPDCTIQEEQHTHGEEEALHEANISISGGRA